MARPPLNDLVAFQTIARLRSFRQAALELAVSASALSHSMRHLEEQLGVRLLQRTTRSVAPTEAGQALLEQLQPALQHIEQALDDLNNFRASPRGSLRLNVPANVAQLFLAPHLGEFLKHYPEIQLEIISSDQRIDIVASGFDAGVRFEESLQQDMIALPLVKHLQFAVVAAPEYLQHYGTPRTLQDLTHHQCLRWRFSDGEHYHWEFIQDNKAIEIAVQGNFMSNDPIMLLTAARQGLGLAYLLKAQVEQDLKQGTLTQVLDNYCPNDVTLFLYYPSRKQSTCLQVFIAYWRAKN